MIRFAILTIALLWNNPEPSPKWTTTFKFAGLNNESELIITGTIPKGWYIYGTKIMVKDGPLKTKIEFTKTPDFELIDDLSAIDPIEKYDEVWDGNVTVFKNEAKFVQKLKLLKAKTIVSGQLIYQMCNEKDGQCVLKKEAFTVKIK